MTHPTKQWYVLYTKPGSEKKVSNVLTRKSIENYYPQKRSWNARGKVMLEPLFSSYVFVQTNEVDLFTVKSIDGVINLAYWLGKPAIIDNADIDLIRNFINEYGSVKLEKIRFEAEGENRVLESKTSGSGAKGHVLSVKNNMVKIILPSLGYIMAAELEKPNAEVISTPKPSIGLLERFQYAV